MALYPKVLYAATITNTRGGNQLLYNPPTYNPPTVPTGRCVIVTLISFFNTGGSAANIALSVTKQGSSTQVKLLPTTSVAAATPLTFNYEVTLSAENATSTNVDKLYCNSGGNFDVLILGIERDL